MTLRYAHVGDRKTEAAAERIGEAVTRALDGHKPGKEDRDPAHFLHSGHRRT